MDLTEKGLLVGALIVVGATFFFASAPARTVAGNVPIPTKTNFQLIKYAGDADGTVHFKATKPIPVGTEFDLDILDNQLSERPEDRSARENLGFNAKLTRNRGLLEVYDFPFDLGTWAGYAPDINSDSTFQVGLRVSPCRFLYGTTAPDFLVSPDHVGVGVSLYPPPDLLGHTWSHWGLGYGHLWAAGDGDSSNVFYLSFSIQTP